MELMKLDDVSTKIITIRDENVILDVDVADLYGVRTMHINQAVKNNPDKFPEWYIFQVSNQDVDNLLSKNLIANVSPKTRFLPKAFTEKGLYMLATILKSPQATQTTLAIVEAFAKMREVSRSVVELMNDHENVGKQQTLMEKGSELLGMIIADDDLDKVGTETSFELNLAAMKVKHKIIRGKKAPVV